MDSQTFLMFMSGYPRRVKTIRNVLIGKKTVSTLFWGMQYGILDYLGVLNRGDLANSSEVLTHLVQTGALVKRDPGKYSLTLAGQRLKGRIKACYDFPRHMAVNLEYDLPRFRQRFLLANQVVSEFSYHNRNYYPLHIGFTDELAVKRWFHFNKDRLVESYCRSLRRILITLERRDPALAWQAAETLVGHRTYGLTNFQISSRLKKPRLEIKFRQLGIVADLVRLVLKASGSVMGKLLNGLTVSPVSQSAELTFGWFKRGMPFRKIARFRSVRVSTVLDHLLSVAILRRQRFPFRSILTKRLINQFNQIYRGDPATWDFNRIKVQTGRSVSFFYFRLYQIMRSKRK